MVCQRGTNAVITNKQVMTQTERTIMTPVSARLKSGLFYGTENSNNPEVIQVDKIEVCEVMKSVNIYKGDIMNSHPFDSFEKVTYKKNL